MNDGLPFFLFNDVLEGFQTSSLLFKEVTATAISQWLRLVVEDYQLANHELTFDGQ